MEKYINSKEAAKVMDCTEQTIRIWASKGLIPFRRFGRNFKYLKSELIHFNKYGLSGKGYIEGRPHQFNAFSETETR